MTMDRTSSGRKKAGYGTKVPSVLRRSKLFWSALPDWLKVQYGRAIKEAATLIARKLTDELRNSEDRDIVQLFVYSSFLDRLRTIKEFPSRMRTHAIGNPLATLHTTGFWLDELYFPEDTVWLSMTVPKRVWWWLVVDPVKRAKFFALVDELFPDGIPEIEVEGDGDADDVGRSQQE